jgi:hypothetical protein
MVTCHVVDRYWKRKKEKWLHEQTPGKGELPLLSAADAVSIQILLSFSIQVNAQRSHEYQFCPSIRQRELQPWTRPKRTIAASGKHSQMRSHLWLRWFKVIPPSCPVPGSSNETQCFFVPSAAFFTSMIVQAVPDQSRQPRPLWTLNVFAHRNFAKV